LIRADLAHTRQDHEKAEPLLDTNRRARTGRVSIGAICDL
jgi:hypothetical protein